MRIVSFIFFLVIASAVITNAQSRDYSGSFSNEDGSVQLILRKSNKEYIGIFIVQGQEFEYSAREINGILQGKYTYLGLQFGLDFGFVEGAYYMESEGLALQLEKTSGNDKNPSTQHGNIAAVDAHLESNGKVKPSSGKKYSDPFGYFTFHSLDRWTVGEEEGSFTLSNSTLNENMVITVTPHHYQSQDQLQRDIKDFIDDQEQIQLKAKSQKGKSGEVLATLSGIVKGYYISIYSVSLFSPHEGGVTIAAIAVGGESAEKFFDFARSIAASIQFLRPVKSSKASQWDKAFRGKQLLYLKTEGGFSDKWSYDLCSDGTFYFKASSSGMSGGASILSYASQDDYSGTWRISARGDKVFLSIFKSDGTTSHLEIGNLGSSNHQVNLNGYRHFIQSNDSCN
ncbi:MAG TPA: hypothetical protein PKC30_10360 [Saprospiraceae bacterium]|mgnify:CR=1 FL=1|nr:hypothetical protein [Saprospiraceae bacterium]